jgi:hypothetical protein
VGQWTEIEAGARARIEAAAAEALTGPLPVRADLLRDVVATA